MAHRGRPHNIGQALLNALSRATSAFGQAKQQEGQQGRIDRQQLFRNNLLLQGGAREQERLGLSQDRFEADYLLPLDDRLLEELANDA